MPSTDHWAGTPCVWRPDSEHAWLSGLPVHLCESSGSLHVQDVQVRLPPGLLLAPRLVSRAGSSSPPSSEGLLASEQPTKPQVWNPAPLSDINYPGAKGCGSLQIS